MPHKKCFTWYGNVRFVSHISIAQDKAPKAPPKDVLTMYSVSIAWYKLHPKGFNCYVSRCGCC